MELVAATLSVKVPAQFRNELHLATIEETFWTDWETVFGYIGN